MRQRRDRPDAGDGALAVVDPLVVDGVLAEVLLGQRHRAATVVSAAEDERADDVRALAGHHAAGKAQREPLHRLPPQDLVLPVAAPPARRVHGRLP